MDKKKALDKLSQNYREAETQYRRTGKETYRRIMNQYQEEMEEVKKYEQSNINGKVNKRLGSKIFTGREPDSHSKVHSGSRPQV